MVSASDFADALAGRFGPVILRFRYQQRDHLFAFEDDLTDAVVAASMALDNARSVVRTARFTFNPDELPVAFDPAEDHIAVIADLLVDGSFAEQPMGLFHLDVPRELHDTGGRELWEVEASDLVTHLLQSRAEGPYTVASGTNYITAVETILDLFTLQHAFPAVADTTPIAFTWPPGTPFYTITRDLLLGINFFPLWPDERGVFTSRERVDPSTETANYSPSTEAEPRMVRAPFEKREDHTRFPNRIVALVDDPNRAPDYALRINNDPTSPISTVNTEATISEVLDAARIVDNATLIEFCEYELRDRAARAETATLHTSFDPRRAPHEFYAVTIEAEEVATLWRVEGWQQALEPEAEMTHTLGRARAVALDTEYEAGVLADSPAGYWRLGEASGDALDSSGNGNDGTVTIGAGVRAAAGLLGGDHPNGSIEFDGADTAIQITDATALQDIFDGGGSLEVLFDPDSDGEGSTGRIIAKGDGSSVGWRLIVQDEAASNVRIRFEVFFSGTDGQWDTAVDIPITSTTHIVVNYDADAAANDPTIYIDGVARTVGGGLTRTSTPTGTRDSDVGEDLFIGNRSAGDVTFDGHIDEVAVYTGADQLTASEIVTHFNVARTN